jgi:DNA phosphorothioation-associated putative methyltransferase
VENRPHTSCEELLTKNVNIFEIQKLVVEANRMRKMAIGKKIGSSVYVHVSALGHLPHSTTDCITRAERIAVPLPFKANVYRIDERKSEVSLLNYKDFDIDPFPCLTESIFVDIGAERFSHRRFAQSKNPPILHKKELLLAKHHPSYKALEGLTLKLEELGLYRNAHTIGHLKQWEDRLSEAGVVIDELGGIQGQVSPD